MHKKLTYPALLTFSLLIVYIGFQQFSNKALVVLGSYIIFLIVMIVLERLCPFDPKWNKDHGDTLHDFFYNFFGALIPIKIIQATLLVLLASVAAALSSKFSHGIWPHNWPLLAQIILCFVIAEFFGYCAHRLRHEIPFLWRFHALHHSPKRLYFLNTARFHPIDIMVGQLFIFPWMVIASVPAEVIFWNSALFQNIGLLSHCNVRFDNFWLIRKIFNTDEHHRWHHSKVVAESNSNYAPSFILWDIIFKTFYTRKDHSAPLALGVTPEFPEKLVDQLLVPFKYSKKPKRRQSARANASKIPPLKG